MLYHNLFDRTTLKRYEYAILQYVILPLRYSFTWVTIIQIMHIIGEPNTKYEMQNDFTEIFKVAGIQQISDLP